LLNLKNSGGKSEFRYLYDFLQEAKWRASVTEFLILEDAMVLAPDLQYTEALFIAFFGFVLARYADYRRD
jgi:hypothetical protein